MENIESFKFVVCLLGFYFAYSIKKDYEQYKITKSFIDMKVFYGGLGVIIASILILIFSLLGF